jgi:hypothetical protein
MEQFRVTEWRDGCVWTTESNGCGWFSEDLVHANVTSYTGIMYVAASDDFARNNMTIRKKNHVEKAS